MVAQNLFFYAIALVMVVSALRLVTTRNVVHAALFLVVVLAGVGAQFILLAAEFVAITQVLIYIGAVVVLLLFGTMLTRARIGEETDLTHSYWYVGAIAAIGLFGLLGLTLVDQFEDTPLPRDTRLVSAQVVTDVGVRPSNSAAISDSIFGQYLVPFEIVSILLTAALIGAIVIARKD